MADPYVVAAARRTLAAALVALALGGCGSPSAAPDIVASSDGDTGVDSAYPGFDFTADLVGGGQLSGGDLAGRDVVLWFWAPW